LETVSLNDIDGTLKRNERCQAAVVPGGTVSSYKNDLEIQIDVTAVLVVGWVGKKRATPYRRSRPITHPPNTESSINLEAVLEEVDNWECLCDGNTSRGNEGRASG
jgi:hypothetical protein